MTETAGDCRNCRGTGNSRWWDENGYFSACWECQGRGRSLEAQITLAFNEFDGDMGSYCPEKSCRYCFGAGYRAAMRHIAPPAGSRWIDERPAVSTPEETP